MAVLEWITTALLVLAMGGIGGMKLVGNKDGIEQAVRLGYDRIRIPIGIAEVMAAVGVVLGAAITDLEWLGAAAAIGIIVMMIGAIGFHLRAGDRFENIPAIVVTIAAALYLVAINAS
ncbi:MAG: DoxX family protein [Actinomycetota bacterium]